MATQPLSHFLARVPASLFGIVLGLAGLAGVWRGAHAAWQMPAIIADLLYVVATGVWLLVTIFYAGKWLVARGPAQAEARHPVQCCFIGLAGVSTMLVAQGVLPWSRPLAVLLIVAGALFTFGFGIWRTGLLWRGERDPGTNTPVLYLPLVAGGFVTGTVASALGWADWGQLAFGAGFFTWLAVESVLLHRLYTGDPLPPPLRPTLGIQLAPPAVGAVSYLATCGGKPDIFVHLLIGYALLQALLLLRSARWILEQPFAPTYWAFTFGATALAGAAIRIATQEPGHAIAVLAPILFLAANILLLLIAVRSLALLGRGRFLPPPAGPIAVPPAR